MLKGKIISFLEHAQNEQIYYETIYNHAQPILGQNEFLFFIKPELTLKSANLDYHSILDLILGKIDQFSLQIKSVKILTAKYLLQYRIIAQHYGVINQLSQTPKKFLSETAKQKFKKLYNLDPETCDIIGSLEIIKKYQEISPTALDYIWQNQTFEKLSSGTYVQPLIFDGDSFFLINGFHPRQLEHYTLEGHSILVFTLKGNLDWKVARNSLIGSTNPEKAEQGSIRHELLRHKNQLGIANISSSWNGVHLSAGPVEALVELVRYNSNYATDHFESFDHYEFGKTLKSCFNESQIQKILDNENVNYQGTKISIFDLTEEKNSDEALNLLKSVFQ